MESALYTVHSLSPIIYARERKSDRSECAAHGGGGVGFASEARKKNREAVDIVGKKWTY